MSNQCEVKEADVCLTLLIREGSGAGAEGGKVKEGLKTRLSGECNQTGTPAF